MSLVLGLGLEHSCPWPRECLSSERLSLALALASDFFCVLGLGLGLEPCVLDSTSAYLIYILLQYIYLSYWRNRDAQILIGSRKSKNSRRTNLRFCVLESDTLQAYRLVFTA